jgi:hypothetical protein
MRFGKGAPPPGVAALAKGCVIGLLLLPILGFAGLLALESARGHASEPEAVAAVFAGVAAMAVALGVTVAYVVGRYAPPGPEDR